MAVSLLFKRKAGIALIGIAAAANGFAEDSVVRVKSCFSLDEVGRAETPRATLLRQLFVDAGVSLEQPSMPDKEFAVCLSTLRGLQGRYVSAEDRVNLDVAQVSNKIEMAVTLRHEMRHRDHTVRGISPWMAGGDNVPPHERIIMGLLAEADARLEEVLLADQMRKKGNRAFVNEWLISDVAPILLRTFDRTMFDSGGDRFAAMRAVIYAFMATRTAHDFYIPRLVYGVMISPEDFPYDPEMRHGTILDDATLSSLVRRAGQADYMDAALGSFLRGLYTPEMYERDGGVMRVVPARPSGP